jgi:ketosteroid isomerase-like protein
VKRCPTCNRTFTDQALSFCTDDGTPLLSVEPPEDEATVVRPSRGRSESDSVAPSSTSGPRDAPAYQPPGAYVPRDYSGQSKRRAWPWIVGLLAIVFVVFAGLAIAAVILIPNMMRAANTNSRNLNGSTGQRNDPNANLNAPNSNPGSNSSDRSENNNDNSTADDTSPAPTDEDEVLQDLTNIEHEWTVANINADKKKLDRILADDYVGTSADGKPQGKAEYLRTATRDTAIQNWNFEDLKLSLKGDRATLTGTITLDVRDDRGQNQNLAFRFTDKFVWRDGRWQATGSVVTSLKGTAA